MISFVFKWLSSSVNLSSIVSVHSIVAQILDGRKLEANQYRFQHFTFYLWWFIFSVYCKQAMQEPGRNLVAKTLLFQLIQLIILFKFILRRFRRHLRIHQTKWSPWFWLSAVEAKIILADAFSWRLHSALLNPVNGNRHQPTTSFDKPGRNLYFHLCRPLCSILFVFTRFYVNCKSKRYCRKQLAN
jgi:hypothetical protein